MQNRSIVVLTDPSAQDYGTWLQFVKPYLDHFGFPYREVRPEDGAAAADCAVVLTGHGGLGCPEAVKQAVEDGAGLVVLDPQFLPAGWCAPAQDGGTRSLRFTGGGHYVAALHEDGEELPLYDELVIAGGSGLADGDTLVYAGAAPLVQAARRGAGKIVLWRSIEWMSHRVLGPLRGADDLLWRGIVWAAKKPFVMQGMPAFVGMRIDDVWGSWRETHPENPLKWVEIAQGFGIKPWLGVFQDNTDQATVDKIREYVLEGRASAFPHAFAGCEWVPSILPEHWAYFDHRARKPYTDQGMAERAQRIADWYRDKGIPISKLALAHYYETGANALPYLVEWGCEFIGIHMQPDTPYGDGEWLRCGPFRNYESGNINGDRPVYYADYLQVENAPEMSGKLFNCVTEIRDVCGYEWHPLCDVEETVRRGVTQLRRAFDSMAVGVLFTHESCYIQRMSPRTWEASLRGITQAVKDYQPLYWTMDDICGYVRARHDMTLRDAALCGENALRLTLDGKNDRATLCYVFTEADGGIAQKLVELPRVSGEAAADIVL